MSKPPTLEYGRPEPNKSTQVPTSVFLIVAGLGITLLGWMMAEGLASSSYARERANQIKCASNLRQIGQDIALYAQDNPGSFPPDLQTLAATQPLGLSVMVCPSSDNQTPASIGAISGAGGCSYIYVGASLTSKADPNCIVALEDPANHGLHGGNILFVDGHVEFIPLYEIQRILNELNAGRNPPYPPATLTPTLSQAGAEQDYQRNWKSRMPQLKTGIWHIPTTQTAKPQ